jgi:hypothetical protein
MGHGRPIHCGLPTTEDYLALHDWFNESKLTLPTFVIVRYDTMRKASFWRSVS